MVLLFSSVGERRQYALKIDPPDLITLHQFVEIATDAILNIKTNNQD